ncbi:DUF4232 domain-containing protein [Streptomyces sp. NPDC004134]|uniref:DUF4232 domain-containing protein n=1 Tax=Streptomyces sp. NPDC004134 TaxID=3364691 RepID=UPI0036A0BC55
MFCARSIRTRFLPAAAVIAALSLTACGGSDAEGAGGLDTGTPADTSADTPSGSSSGSLPEDDAERGVPGSPAAGDGSRAAGEGGAAADGDGTATCDGSRTKTVAAPVHRPVNHMLLTVTNTGSGDCRLYHYPAVRFGAAQSVPPVVEASQPQSVVTLAPGESGYAAVSLAAVDGSGTNSRTHESLTVYFRDRAGGDAGPAARPPLPAGGVRVDDTLMVTYWQPELDAALAW